MNSLDLMVHNAKKKQGLKIAVAAAEDKTTLYALKWIVMKDLGDPILIGSKNKILEVSSEIDFDIQRLDIIDVDNQQEATVVAVNLVRDGRAHVLARGAISASAFLAIISNERSRLEKSHNPLNVTFLNISNYHKVFAILSPGAHEQLELCQLVDTMTQLSKVFHNLGISIPKIAFMSDIETAKKPTLSMVDISELTQMSKAQKIPNCIIDGPIDIENAFCSKNFWGVSEETSPTEGDIDALFLPDLNSESLFYKMSMIFNGAKSAGVIIGMEYPIACSSYVDTVETKFYSMVLALFQCHE